MALNCNAKILDKVLSSFQSHFKLWGEQMAVMNAMNRLMLSIQE
jgi:hypothetical protein